jgi:hypothetical protein
MEIECERDLGERPDIQANNALVVERKERWESLLKYSSLTAMLPAGQTMHERYRG